MAKFITTIELFGSNENDFQEINKAFENQNFRFSKFLPVLKTASSSKKAEYKVAGNLSLENVSKAVSKILAGSGRQYSFTIIKSKPLKSSLLNEY